MILYCFLRNIFTQSCNNNVDITGKTAAASGRNDQDADISEEHLPKERGLNTFF